jgi:phage terminase large subunit-like protein
MAVGLDAGRVNLDKAYQYAADVDSEKIISCKYVKLSVKRWFSDLENGNERGFYFSEETAADFFRFSDNYCRHYQGEHAGKIIIFEPWQAFILANIFGWLRSEDGSRRFRTIYEEVARKNGKTTKLATVGTYLAAGDYEPGAKVYCAATKREQAREIFDTIGKMVKQDQVLRRAMKPLRNIIHSETKNSPNSSINLLSADYDSMDGLNVHAALVDEIHAHKDSGVWDVLESARGARNQPIMWGITTAGKNHNSFCYEMRGYAIKVLEGSVPAVECDHFFAIIFTIDEKDDWLDEKIWIKANPNLGVSVSISDIREQCQKAKEMPTARIEFMTKRLNVWVYGEATWMNMEKWNACTDLEFDERKCWDKEQYCELDGADCYGGLDLASVEDLCAFSLDFKIDGKHIIICKAYLPELGFQKRIDRGGNLKGLYQKFVDEGCLIITPGEVCDYSYIKQDIIQACERFNVKEIGFDRFNSSQLVSELLAEEVPMVAMGQGIGSINAPMKEMLKIVLSGEVRHNNSLLTFAMSNVVANVNAAGDIKFDKSKVSEKIDPAVAAIMALGRSTVYEEDNTEAIDDFLMNPVKI